MKKQYVGRRNGKKIYLIRIGNTAMWFSCSLAGSETMSLLLEEQIQKEVKKRSCNTLGAPNEHVNYLKKIIISCIFIP